MPLHRGEVRAALASERLDEAVGRGGERHEARGEVLDGLVVPGVHEDAVHRRQDRAQRESARQVAGNPDDVRGVGPIVPVTAREGVLDAARALGGKVLPECPAERDVDDLEPPADAEDGGFEANGPREEIEIERVAPGVDVDRAVHRRFAVAGRVDVAPARQEEPVELPGKDVPRLDDLHLVREGPGGEKGAPVTGVRLSGVDGEDDLHVSRRVVPAGFTGGNPV